MTGVLRAIGKKTLSAAESVGTVSLLSKKMIGGLFGARSEFRLFIGQLNEIGVRSFPVVCLTSLFTGMVLCLQTGLAFMKVFNEPVYLGTAVGLSLVKELGPVLTSLVVAGRVGAAIAAELGTMAVTEQLDALSTLGTSPVRYLGVPRFAACLLAVPLLTVFADFIGVFGGYVVAKVRFAIPPSVFWDDILVSMKIKDSFHGLIKSFFFGGIIVTTACYKGFTCSGGAEGVGRATTSAVVISMVLILVCDYFLTSVLVSFGIG
jgi:phospholipid/cholesterol/gamma-HCH transport system permease protein